MNLRFILIRSIIDVLSAWKNSIPLTLLDNISNLANAIGRKKSIANNASGDPQNMFGMKVDTGHIS